MAPQMPWLAFSLAMLARFGPEFPDVLDFVLMPAEVLAVDQRELKASPDGLALAGLLEILLPKDWVDVSEGLGWDAPVVADGWIWTEV